MSKKKSDDVIAESCKKYLKYDFTEEEIKDLGKNLAKVFADHSEAEARLKSVSTQIKAEIATIEGTMTSLSEKIRSGHEYRDIECRKEFNYTLGKVSVFRNDTDEVIEERAMTGEERQANLDLKEKEKSDVAQPVAPATQY